MIENKELIEGNELIMDFLDWDKRYSKSGESCWFKIPSDLLRNDFDDEASLEELYFEYDWSWIHFLWDELHRKVCIPMVRDNNHLKYLRPLIQETKKAIVWGHKETVYKNMVKLIKVYNEQFNS